MSNIIDSIQVSGVNYILSAASGGASAVEVTQAEYDALVSGGTVDPTVFYIITDAQPADLSNYWTSAETQSAITEATSGKLDTSVFEAYSGSVDTALGNKQDTSGMTAYTENTAFTAHSGDSAIHVTASDKSNWNAKSDFSGSYNDLTDKPTIPTVPTSNTAFTNDAGYATSGYVDSAVTAVQDSLSGYVTTDTLQDITEQKTFVGDPTNKKKSIKFKQYDNASKVGFVMVNSAETNNELATFEFRPDSYTDSSSVSHPLLYIGHYRNNNIANAGVPQTMVGFRQYDQSGAAAYHYLMPLPSEAKLPFSLTTTFKDYFAPLGFKNGSTMITTDNTGVADFSSVLGGLKFVKLTQSAYDALSPNYDSNTLYVIVN